MLPEPALSFTIPSLHDGIVLDCRVYHPASLAAANAKAPPWRRHAAVVAHPYAPMGGCYDDPILESVATQLLRTGYVVGTFNFRYSFLCLAALFFFLDPRDGLVMMNGWLTWSTTNVEVQHTRLGELLGLRNRSEMIMRVWLASWCIIYIS